MYTSSQTGPFIHIQAKIWVFSDISILWLFRNFDRLYSRNWRLVQGCSLQITLYKLGDRYPIWQHFLHHVNWHYVFTIFICEASCRQTCDKVPCVDTVFWTSVDMLHVILRKSNAQRSLSQMPPDLPVSCLRSKTIVTQCLTPLPRLQAF